MKKFWKLGSFFSMLVTMTAANAHPHEAATGSVMQFFHPHLGFEHILAAIVIGLLVVGIIKRKS